MSKLRNALAVAMLAALAAASSAQAADIILVNLDGAAEGYNDTTVVAPVGGNPGTTRGQQRQFVAAYAAQLAREKRRQVYGDVVFVRGLMEISNICGNDCYYCGIRRSNRALRRCICQPWHRKCLT